MSPQSEFVFREVTSSRNLQSKSKLKSHPWRQYQMMFLELKTSNVGYYFFEYLPRSLAARQIRHTSPVDWYMVSSPFVLRRTQIMSTSTVS